MLCLSFAYCGANDKRDGVSLSHHPGVTQGLRHSCCLAVCRRPSVFFLQAHSSPAVGLGAIRCGFFKLGIQFKKRKGFFLCLYETN